VRRQSHLRCGHRDMCAGTDVRWPENVWHCVYVPRNRNLPRLANVSIEQYLRGPANLFGHGVVRRHDHLFGHANVSGVGHLYRFGNLSGRSEL
jgi:hypothetical protein